MVFFTVLNQSFHIIIIIGQKISFQVLELFVEANDLKQAREEAKKSYWT
tara:strand:- start:215 stop:361 length:147 start_codon:yes stop_codon:yes gene_type:complete